MWLSQWQEFDLVCPVVVTGRLHDQAEVVDYGPDGSIRLHQEEARHGFAASDSLGSELRHCPLVVGQNDTVFSCGEPKDFGIFRFGESDRACQEDLEAEVSTEESRHDRLVEVVVSKELDH